LIKPLSVFAGQKTAHLLDHHVIKWCKLFSMITIGMAASTS
jgi:hypothetical protein